MAGLWLELLGAQLGAAMTDQQTEQTEQKNGSKRAKAALTHLTAMSTVRASALPENRDIKLILRQDAARGAGRLILIARNGVGRWAYQYASRPGKTDELPLGFFADTARRSANREDGLLSMIQAAAEATKMSALRATLPDGDLRGHLEREQAEIARARLEQARLAEKEKAAATARKRYTLAALIREYCDHLVKCKRHSADAVRAALELHVIKGAPDLAETAACEVTRSQIAVLIRAVHEAGKDRTAGMLRAYLHAAYALAIGAEGDTSASSELIAFKIENNPVAGVKTIPVAKRKRFLTESELQAFMLRMDADPGAVADLLRASLWAGGQRPEQMSRLTVADFDPVNGTIRVLDPKGRRQEPRVHIVPLAAVARRQVELLVERAKQRNSPWLFSSTGKLRVQVSRFSHWLKPRVEEMIKSGELSSPFTARDLRRTTDTMLAGMGINEETRDVLLSHNQGGLKLNYNLHHYLEEKRAANAAWEARLLAIREGTPPASNVVQLRRA